jgi:hypothetical protein
LPSFTNFGKYDAMAPSRKDELWNSVDSVIEALCSMQGMILILFVSLIAGAAFKFNQQQEDAAELAKYSSTHVPEDVSLVNGALDAAPDQMIAAPAGPQVSTATYAPNQSGPTMQQASLLQQPAPMQQGAPMQQMAMQQIPSVQPLPSARTFGSQYRGMYGQKTAFVAEPDMNGTRLKMIVTH